MHMLPVMIRRVPIASPLFKKAAAESVGARQEAKVIQHLVHCSHATVSLAANSVRIGELVKSQLCKEWGDDGDVLTQKTNLYEFHTHYLL